MSETWKFGSHNSWSFSPVKQWWLKPFYWVAKCQNKNIMEQWSVGVRCFDLRVKYEHGKFVLAHGLIKYNYDYNDDLSFLEYKAKYSRQKYYCRVLLETRNFTFSEATEFCIFCHHLVEKFPHIKFFGGFPTRHWSKYLYHFEDPEPTLDDKYSSVIKPKIQGIWPWLYAHRHNEENILQGTDKDFLFIDFI